MPHDIFVPYVAHRRTKWTMVLRRAAGKATDPAAPRQANRRTACMRMIGIDVGGTFTDLVYADTDSGMVAIHKVSTTPSDPSIAMMAGIEQLCAAHDVPLGTINVVLHATTIATNAVLEYNGCRAGML